MLGSPLAVIFLTVLIDLVGFGIVLPLLPFYAEELGTNPTGVGLLVAVYSLMQFFFAPFWGKLSDRVGRRPIILLGLVGSGVSYVIFAFAQTLTVLFFSRILAGLMGANIAVAQAYIADRTEAQDRARGMGLIGAAFGLGFILGPAIGGVFSQWGYGVPGLIAAGLCFGNATLAWRVLPESLTPELRSAPEARGRPGPVERIRALADAWSRSELRPILALFFIGTMVFAAFTTTFPLLLERRLDLDARHAGYFLAFAGLVMAVVQGRLIGPLARRLGERKLLVIGSAVLVLGYGVTPWVWSDLAVALVILPIAFGTGVSTPSLASLTSQVAGAAEQGQVLGVSQSLSSLGRVVGPTWGGWLFATWGHGAPYWLSAGWMLVAVVLALHLLRRPAPAAAEVASTSLRTEEG